MAFYQQFKRLQALGLKKALQMKWENFLWTKLFSFGQVFGLSILPSHFYSPVPNTKELRRTFRRWYSPSDMLGVEMNLPAQVEFMAHLVPFREECVELPDFHAVSQMGLGEGYALVDAHLLYAMLRFLQPHRLVEVGSGVSTWFEREALKRNQQETGAASELVCIEPYPRKGLLALAERGDVKLLRTPVQDVDVSWFKQLQSGDVLFIDSSHVLKLDSDVYYLYLEVLPRLNKGVVVHIHDIFFPYPTPEPETWIFRQHQFWNEVPLVQAMLMHSTAWRVLVCGSYLDWCSPETLQTVFNVYKPRETAVSSLWLQKVI